MPIIDGVKVACIPCIRGHRSTKCTHQTERIMIPVRKPGRPLSSCPHQKGKPCNCNNITAAIPRNSKCGCGTSEPPIIETAAVVKPEPPTPDVTPLSPVRGSSFRVQKHTSTKSHGRKQSFDISLLGQMDPNAINMMSSNSANPETNGNIMHTSPVTSPSFIPNFQNSFNHEVSIAPDFRYGQMLERLNGGPLNTFFNGHQNIITAPRPDSLSNHESQGQLSLNASGTPHYALSVKSPGLGTHRQGISATEGRSCCAKGPANTSSVNGQLEEHKLQPKNAVGMIGYGNLLSTRNHNASPPVFTTNINERTVMQYTSQNPAYTYPSSYGSSFYEPLQFAHWQQMMANQSQNISPQNGYMNAHSEIGTAAPVSYSTANQCGCGEGCQCLGCATHPFNSAMQEYVLSAMQDEQSISPSLSNGDSNGVPSVANEASPGVLPSPLAGASPASEAGSASVASTTGINDYLFVSYCPGSPQSCPCGDDCACVGCMIHGQPAPMTPVTPR